LPPFARLHPYRPGCLLTVKQRILEANSQLTRTLSEDRVPPLHRLQQILEQEINVWHEHEEWKPQQEDDDNPRRGQKVATW
jgi:hypothetical protein